MITKHTCKNGVRIVTENIPTVRSVAIGIWIGTGSRFEDKNNNGISHFLEHMFFKGTKTRSAREIAESFDSIGGQVNAFTSKEYTCYYSKVLDKHADYALDTLADMFFNSTFVDEELVKEKNVVLEEIKMYEDTPDDIVHDLLSQATYSHHPLAYPILGTEQTLKSFTGDSLRKYMNEYYTPDNIVISIAGNIDASFIQKVEDYFGGFKTEHTKPEMIKPQFCAEKKARKKETEQAHLCLGYEGLPVGDDSIFDLIVLNNIFGGSMSSRLFQEVREQRGLAYSVFSYHSAHLDTGVFNIYAGTAPGQIDEVYKTIDSIIDSLKQNGVTDKEVSNSKEQIKGNLMLSLESTNSRMSRNGRHELLLKHHRSLDEMTERIDAVSKQNVDRLVHSIFSNDFSSSLISPTGQFPSKFPN
ncbi:pitrilysin family protein [Alkalihalobacillus sp. AL-G]|uniref:M16 family metallopeptidase n=1 Tax=Alkalihalobacillus sp. AL-G TaxID=2926399 RepID=UPI00272CC4B5|nr:pitrilysin family protein [Alkalihalobacillus sp. AL-G]WLD95201.1 insulinase family protein [Alkalihalobacillus sp. AL-G]